MAEDAESEMGTYRHSHGVFNGEEWVRYTRYQTEAAILVIVGLLAFAVGLDLAVESLTVHQAGAWFTVDIQGNGLLFGSVLEATGIVIALWAPRRWQKARIVRRHAETRAMANTTFVTIVATTILKTLQNIAESNAHDTTRVRDRPGTGNRRRDNCTNPTQESHE